MAGEKKKWTVVFISEQHNTNWNSETFVKFLPCGEMGHKTFYTDK